MENAITIIGLVLGGGGVGFFFNYLISNRKTDHDEFKILLDTWKDENRELKERERRNSDRIFELINEVSRLKHRIIILSIQAGVPAGDLIKEIDPKANESQPVGDNHTT